MAGLQANIYAAVGITWIAALMALIARVGARRITKVAWWIDDYFCLAAFVSHQMACYSTRWIAILTGFPFRCLRQDTPSFSSFVNTPLNDNKNDGDDLTNIHQGQRIGTWDNCSHWT